MSDDREEHGRDFESALREAAATYTDAIDELLSGLNLPPDEFTAIVGKFPAIVHRYKEALQLAAEHSDEHDRAEYRHAVGNITQKTATILSTVTGYRRRRKAAETSEAE